MSDDRPVFVDASGRRRRTTRMVVLICAAAAFTAVALVTAALFGAPLGPLTVLPAPTVPDQTSQRPAPPVPTAGPRPGPDGSAPPSPSPVVPTESRVPGSPTTPPGQATTKPGNPSAPGHDGTHGRPTDRPTPPGKSR